MIFNEIFPHHGMNSINIQYAKMYFHLSNSSRIPCKFMVTVKVMIAPNSASGYLPNSCSSPSPCA